VAILLLAVSLVAIVVPARRALSVDNYRTAKNTPFAIFNRIKNSNRFIRQPENKMHVACWEHPLAI